jgi:hypothetical protein
MIPSVQIDANKYWTEARRHAILQTEEGGGGEKRRWKGRRNRNVHPEAGVKEKRRRKGRGREKDRMGQVGGRCALCACPK